MSLSLDAVATELRADAAARALKAEVGADAGGVRAKTLVQGGSRVGLRHAANGYRP